MQCVVRNAVIANEVDGLLAGPVEQRIYFDQPAPLVERRKRGVGALA
jgi:hypothetical protein